MSSTIWFIDEEWTQYDIEKELLNKSLPSHKLKFSNKKNYFSDLHEMGGRADAVIAQIDIEISKEFIKKLSKCKIISVYGVGYEHIDVQAAFDNKITVSNVPDFCTHEVSDHIIAFIYHFNKNVTGLHHKIRRGLWGINAVDVLPKRLYGTNVYIIGFGNIGKEVARKTTNLGMNAYSFDPFLSEEDLRRHNAEKVDWKTGFQIADFVVVTTKLTEKTRGMIGINEFKMMKKGAIFINTSRGEVVREKELIKAVEEKMIAGAALDVTSPEPPDVDGDLLKCKNILITPHVSYLSEESISELREKTVQNVISFLKYNKPINVVAP